MAGDAYFDDEENEDDDQLFETMDDTPAKIQPGLLIGSFLAEQNKEKLRRAGVTHVLQASWLPRHATPRRARQCDRLPLHCVTGVGAGGWCVRRWPRG